MDGARCTRCNGIDGDGEAVVGVTTIGVVIAGGIGELAIGHRESHRTTHIRAVGRVGHLALCAGAGEVGQRTGGDTTATHGLGDVAQGEAGTRIFTEGEGQGDAAGFVHDCGVGRHCYGWTDGVHRQGEVVVAITTIGIEVARRIGEGA